MVDTINILVRWPLLPEILAALQAAGFYRGGGWYFETVTREEKRTGKTHVKLSGHHEILSITIKGKDGVIEWVQASLPRLLFGYNGRLITNPAQLDCSLDRLFGHLAGIATAENRLIEFIRVDLALNLPCDPKRFIVAHRNARHPWVKSDSIEYGSTGIRFPGKKRVLHLYCKQKERADKSGFKMPLRTKSIRAEVQVKGTEAVRAFFGHAPDAPVTSLDFFKCYRCYREAWCLFDKGPVISSPGEHCSLLKLIAECEAVGFKTSHGIGAMAWWELGNKKPATVNRMKGDLQKRKQALMEFKWAEILTPGRLPEPVVDIYADGREVLLRDLW